MAMNRELVNLRNQIVKQVDKQLEKAIEPMNRAANHHAEEVSKWQTYRCSVLEKKLRISQLQVKKRNIQLKIIARRHDRLEERYKRTIQLMESDPQPANIAPIQQVPETQLNPAHLDTAPSVIEYAPIESYDDQTVFLGHPTISADDAEQAMAFTQFIGGYSYYNDIDARI